MACVHPPEPSQISSTYLTFPTSHLHLPTSSAVHNMRYLVPRLHAVSRMFERETTCMTRKPQYKSRLRCNDGKSEFLLTKAAGNNSLIDALIIVRVWVGESPFSHACVFHRFRHRNSHAVQPSPWSSISSPRFPRCNNPKIT